MKLFCVECYIYARKGIWFRLCFRVISYCSTVVLGQQQVAQKRSTQAPAAQCRNCAGAFAEKTAWQISGVRARAVCFEWGWGVEGVVRLPERLPARCEAVEAGEAAGKAGWI